jgi:hypothetical protein
MNDDEIYEAVFADFAGIYPHEAYKINPSLFWKQFRARRPGVSREQMIESLGDSKE